MRRGYPNKGPIGVGPVNPLVLHPTVYMGLYRLGWWFETEESIIGRFKTVAQLYHSVTQHNYIRNCWICAYSRAVCLSLFENCLKKYFIFTFFFLKADDFFFVSANFMYKKKISTTFHNSVFNVLHYLRYRTIFREPNFRIMRPGVKNMIFFLYHTWRCTLWLIKSDLFV